MPNDPLVKVDRMSMAHALEVRCPLLDRRVVELGFRIPASRKQANGEGKVLLRQLARHRLPEGVWQLPKRGFTAPISEWIGRPQAALFREQVLGLRSNVAGLVDRRTLDEWFEEQRTSRRDRSFALWAVWTLERWLRSEFWDTGRPVAGPDSVCL
jgi:asparagine synthase (glutamine-hydrolysing)